ncbi:YdeI/OmpD-associated family protein [Aliiroseovarius sp. Z3]|uniref:YdeI/OmpD-associated family protein n=1 Tax=Aliiroseovarius sp. Z3 TaxID=2811402 RepID=UPI0023B215A7|nr:YdeI/OmpD-associated family protein [Aliiroseovarius sp. Z3]MDE9449798.1 YdeI/OmpD-associated family protein [Aliiroseovarius sp. Z3]
MANDPEVADLLKQTSWQDERRKLRDILRDCGLEERVKWGKLCYTYQDNNVAIIYGMKESCALGFFKGALLEDQNGVLIQPGKHSQAMRRLHFESLDEIERGEDMIRRFIGRAIKAEQDGLQVAFTEKDNLDYPDELQEALDDDPELAEAFDDLTPGRQRGWVLHFSSAKQSETRLRRIDKARSKIIAGKGWNESS